MTQNPYQVLGVPNGADLAECTQAYKRLAKKYHPDLNPGDRVAEAKMAEVNAAFDANMHRPLTCWAIWIRAIPAGTIWPLWPIWATAIRKRLWQTFALP